MSTYTPEIQKLIDDTSAAHEAQSGHSRLWGWFGLSRASFLVVPRVMLHAMPDEWQKRMAVLLEEYEEAFPDHPDTTCNVQHRVDNKFAKWPEWLLKYRHPNAVEIQKARGEKAAGTVTCTLCAAEESPGFYTGCMVKDGHAPEWDCDGKGNLTRKREPSHDCEVCGGDCASANPPVMNCPNQESR